MYSKVCNKNKTAKHPKLGERPKLGLDLHLHNWKGRAMKPKAKPDYLLKKPVLSYTNNQARERAASKLNHQRPKFLPDLFFVRRSKTKLAEYLEKDERELKRSLANQSPKVKENYTIFKLRASEEYRGKQEDPAKSYYDGSAMLKRSMQEMDDPFYQRKYFNRSIGRPLETEELVTILDPMDSKRLRKKTMENMKK